MCIFVREQSFQSFFKGRERYRLKRHEMCWREGCLVNDSGRTWKGPLKHGSMQEAEFRKALWLQRRVARRSYAQLCVSSSRVSSFQPIKVVSKSRQWQCLTYWGCDAVSRTLTVGNDYSGVHPRDWSDVKAKISPAIPKTIIAFSCQPRLTDINHVRGFACPSGRKTTPVFSQII